MSSIFSVEIFSENSYSFFYFFITEYAKQEEHYVLCTICMYIEYVL